MFGEFLIIPLLENQRWARATKHDNKNPVYYNLSGIFWQLGNCMLPNTRWQNRRIRWDHQRFMINELPPFYRFIPFLQVFTTKVDHEHFLEFRGIFIWSCLWTCSSRSTGCRVGSAWARLSRPGRWCSWPTVQQQNPTVQDIQTCSQNLCWNLILSEKMSQWSSPTNSNLKKSKLVRQPKRILVCYFQFLFCRFLDSTLGPWFILLHLQVTGAVQRAPSARGVAEQTRLYLRVGKLDGTGSRKTIFVVMLWLIATSRLSKEKEGQYVYIYMYIIV